MPLAALAGLGHPALVHGGGLPGAKLGLADIALVGVRSIDPPERALLDRHPELLAIDADDIAERGLDRTIVRLLAWAARFEAIYLSFDLDAIRSSDAPGVTTPVPHDGLSRDDAVALVDQLAGALPIFGADFVEYWPAHDTGGKTIRLLHDLVDELLRARAREWRGWSLKV
jgi:arginase family enzyme